ncbi:MAG: hypothetical protein LUD22_00700 [Coprobacillus sp.]|nr:hypothetical protein [Coprobacillus sp.]
MAQDVETQILEPIDEYRHTYKQKVNDGAESTFDDLVQKSGVNLDEHRLHVKNYEGAKKQLEAYKKKQNNNKGLNTFLIVLAVIGGVAAVIGLFVLLFGESVVGGSVTMTIGIVVLVASLCVKYLYLNKRSRAHNKKLEELQKKVAELYKICTDEVRRVTSLFDWNMPAKIIRENVPLIQIDDHFDMQKYDYMMHKYKLGDNKDKNCSTLFVLSGSIVGNPFLFMRNIYTYMGTRVYTGTRMVTYPVRVPDGRGRWHTVMQTAPLVATLEKPCPQYGYETFLLYANDAAPDLTFTRSPTIQGKNEKQIDSYVKSETKALHKTANKAVKKGTNFTPMTNYDFETIFHAWNRNNEVQFRLLYTPLAQENTLKLIKNTQGVSYGDDFQFRKAKYANYIMSDHSKNLDIYMRPDRWGEYYSLDMLRKDFVDYVNTYFKSLYFDLAPILSIPIYQQNKPSEYIYQKSYTQNYTTLEDEVLANSFPLSTFKAEGTKTNVILKTKATKKGKNRDVVQVTANSYRVEHHVEAVPMPAPNGVVYPVPVNWDEYFPISKTTEINVTDTRGSLQDYKSKAESFSNSTSGSLKSPHMYRHGMLAILRALDSDNEQDLDNAIDTFFGYNRKEKNSSESTSDSDIKK